MNCPKCGTPSTGDNQFCINCGASLVQAPPPPQQQPVYTAPPAPQQPVYAPPPQSYQPAYAGMPMKAPKKKKHIGRWIALILLLAVVGAVGWFIGTLSLFGPKDLGVDYTMADFNNAMAKTGIKINFNNMSDAELEQFKADLKGKKLNIDDYNWEFTDYQRKTFALSPSEATALLNEIAPNFWWFDNLQVNILPDGTMEGSSTADIKRLKTDLFSDVADQIPIPLPDKVNIYSKGVVSITDNTLTGNPEKFNVGPLPLPDQFMTPDSVDTIASYSERIYTKIPGLEINSLGADADGNFAFDGVIPQSVTITPKS